MKNIREKLDDSLRPEYTRSDFGEMIQGKYATTQLDFAELAGLLLTCIAEDEGLTFTRHSAGNLQNLLLTHVRNLKANVRAL
ncbi:MAG TPA: hypothetical protein VFY60_01095 [Pyrinomonadaceae bacterium]|nr:hypothetical protein [Pyrinomonadaceae bacterium]